MRRSIPKTTRRGFTLMEALLAIAVFGLIAAAATGLLRQTLAAREVGGVRAAALADLQIARALMAADIAQIALRAPRGPDGQAGLLPFEGFREEARDEHGDRLVLRFVRTGWENPGMLEDRGTVQQVVYVLRDGALIRRSWARVDPTPETPVSERALLTGVTDLRVLYSAQGQDLPLWQGGSRNALPTAVTFEIKGTAFDDLRLSFLAGVGR